MAAMSGSSDWWVELSDTDKEKAKPQFEMEYDISELEMGQFSLGTLPRGKVRYAQPKFTRKCIEL